MVIATLQSIFSRDLNRLKNEISSYENESEIWVIEKNISNSAGNLTLHLIGNLNTYIGSVFGDSNYERNREAEFTLKNIPRKELLQKIEDTIVTVNDALSIINEEILDKEYPLLVFEKKTSTGYMLIHLTTHLTYHLGQINYHRRFLDQ